MHKLRVGRQLTATDLAELERILVASGEFTDEEIARGAREAHGLGLFIRSIVGMDRAAVMDALAEFVSDTTLSGNQFAFIDLTLSP